MISTLDPRMHDTVRRPPGAVGGSRPDHRAARENALSVMVWHVHGAYTTNLVQGRHQYLLPVTPGSPQGRRRATWPDRVQEVTPEQGRHAEVDVVIVQSSTQLDQAEQWLGGRRPGRDLPLVYLEHNV
ncbi:MAG: hypothetical protein ABR564_07115, partial [Candidatus Dormibacteria bacterium]